MANAIELTTFADSINIIAASEYPISLWEEAGINFFNKVVELCEAKGVLAIGHIKGFLSLQNGGYMYFSSTGKGQETHCKKDAEGKTSIGKFDLNVLVYGLDKETVKNLVNEALSVIKEQLNASYQAQKN
jgi:hypothetical protein